MAKIFISEHLKVFIFEKRNLHLNFNFKLKALRCKINNSKVLELFLNSSCMQLNTTDIANLPITYSIIYRVSTETMLTLAENILGRIGVLTTTRLGLGKDISDLDEGVRLIRIKSLASILIDKDLIRIFRTLLIHIKSLASN
jgi:hypothetical protein